MPIIKLCYASSSWGFESGSRLEQRPFMYSVWQPLQEEVVLGHRGEETNFAPDRGGRKRRFNGREGLE